MASAWPGGIDSVPDITNPTVTDCNVAPTLSTRLNLATDAVTAIETWLQANVSSWVPPSGMITQFAGSTAPAGWLICDGSLQSKTTYPNLFAVCGTLYGPGGAGTFNLPDLRSRSPMGAGTGAGLSGRSLGAQLGEENHTLSGGELAAHNHGINDPGHTHGIGDPGHTHPIGDPGHTHGVNDPGHNHTVLAANTATASPGISVFGVASSQPIIGTGVSGTGISIQASGTGVYTGASGTGVYTGAAGTGVSTQNAGSNGGHNTIHPVTVVNMIIKT